MTSSFVSSIGAHALVRPESPALVFLADGESESTRLSYSELDRRARACAAQLQSEGLGGQTVLLALPSSDGYVCALLGCLYAGVRAVPAYPAGRGPHAQRLASIVADARPAAVIVGDDHRWLSAGWTQEAGGCKVLTLAQALKGDPQAWVPPATSDESIAYLQYTSGSTSQPRGVQVTHRNLIEYCRHWMAPDVLCSEDVVVTWLPLFHDFGLVQGVLQPLQAGACIVLMPPMAFLQRPARWLQAISRYDGTVSCAPDFAYALTADADVPQLDLSSWAIAGNAAEPVRAETLDKFMRRFSSYGFRAEAMNPSYGLAEATLGVTFHPRVARAQTLQVDTVALLQGRLQPVQTASQSRRLVSCGRPWGDTRVVIVDPVHCTPCADGTVGEIWVQGSIVTAGYQGQAEVTEAVFGARLHDGEGPFLRTGDLGALHGGELYVTGRLKDLIIIRGQNHYPQDIEQTVAAAHPDLQGGRGAAFGVDTDDGEALVVVQEVQRSARHRLDGEGVTRAVRTAVAEAHGLQPRAVVLVQQASAPVTSSGKIQRRACREAFLANQLKTLHVWRAQEAANAAPSAPSADDIVSWLAERIGELQQQPASTVDVHATFAHLGLDSASLVALSAQLADWLGRPVSPTLPYSAPTITKLAAHLAGFDGHLEPDAGMTPAEPIAVVGMACRLPGADGLDEYWTLLDSGQDAITEVPADRWSTDEFYQPGVAGPGKSNSKWGGFIADIDRFDAAFFGISPREAQSTDPQQRLLLQAAWHALEDAGIVPASLAGSDTGVFIGAASADYETISLMADASLDAYCGTGVHASIMANRISYLLDLRGPSVTLQTACSASLMALHEARGSLLQRECNLALVGGVNLMLAPQLFVALSQARMLSPDGRCMTFDARANGYVRAEGYVMLVLKRLPDALRDKDRIHGIVAGSAVNQDGRSNGLTAPNGDAQRMVIERALASAGVPAGRVSYVEAHGTGTALGDPIEMEALQRAYGRPSAEQPTLWVGAVKSQIGHTESVAGLAGFVKVLLAMRHERIPANLHLREINPRIVLDGSRCAIVTSPQPWPHGGRPRLAGVSAFGFGGTNVHVILQEPPAVPHSLPDAGQSELLVLSARTPAALQQLAVATASQLEKDSPALSATCYTAAARRTHFEHRLAVVGATRHEMAQALRGGAASETSELGRTAFLFTGQGSQYPGMAQSLYQSHALFRDTVDRCDEILRPLLGGSLRQVLRGEPGDLDLGQTRHAQPALFAVEYALAELWRSAGAQPHCLLGHSLGEYVAACVAGVFSLEDALTLVTHRGRLMHEATPEGAMIALHGPDNVLDAWLAELESAMPANVAVAARNTPNDVVLAGEPKATEALAAQAVACGAVAKPLVVNRAFHSPLMDSMIGAFEREARRVRYSEPRMPVISNLDGRVAGASMADARYWIDQARQPVEFVACLRTLQSLGCRTFIEVGPHPVLSAFGRQVLGGGIWLPSLRRGMDAERQMLTSLGRWYEQGASVDWRGWWQGRRGESAPAPVDLPLYPMQGERYWFTPAPAALRTGPSLHPLLRERLPVSGSSVHRFAGTIMATEPWFVDQCRVFDTPSMPTAGMLETLLAAARLSAPQPLPQWTLKKVALRRTPVLREGEALDWQAAVKSRNGVMEITLRGRPVNEPDAEWSEYASCSAQPSYLQLEPKQPISDGMAEQAVPGLYQRLREMCMNYGPGLQGLQRLWLSGNEAVGRIEIPEPARSEAQRYQLHPAMLEACLQVTLAFVERLDTPAHTLWRPTALDSLSVMRRLPSQAWVRVVWHGEVEPRRQRATVGVFDDEGRPVLQLQGLDFTTVARDEVLDRPEPADEPPAYGVRWVPMTPGANVEPATAPWLLLVPEPLALAPLVAACRESGLPVVAVGTAAALSWQRQDQVVLDWNSETQWAALLGELETRGVVPQGLWLHIAGVGIADAPVEAAYRLCHAGFLALRHTLPMWIDRGRQAPDVLFCTRGATAPDAAVEAGECLSDAGLAQSVFNGLVKALAMDYPFSRCVQVDLPPGEARIPVTEILAAVQASRGSSQLALRGGQVWQSRAMLQPRGRWQAQPVSVHADASYLVTGGLRGIGLASASWLVAQGARRIVLLGRSIPVEAQPAIAAMEAAGARIVVVQADVADAASLHAGLSRSLATLPPLRGVLHCAGLTEDRLFADLDWPAFERVLAPKIQGAWNLHRLTRDVPLDFFVLYSSVTALGGNAGQANYIAGCAFLDSLATYRRHRGMPAISVQWGYWSDTGMATVAAVSTKVVHMGLRGINTQDGLRALGRALATAPVQTAPVWADWDRFKLVRCPGLPPTWLADIGQTPVDAAASEPANHLPPAGELAGMPAPRAKTLLLGWLLDNAATVLRLPAHHRQQLTASFAQTPLQQLGFDSLMAVEMRHRVRREFDISVLLTYFMTGVTAGEIADHLHRQLVAAALERGTSDMTGLEETVL